MSRVLSLAGFEVTLIGRFWVIPEGFRQRKSLAIFTWHRALNFIDATRETSNRCCNVVYQRSNGWRHFFVVWLLMRSPCLKPKVVQLGTNYRGGPKQL